MTIQALSGQGFWFPPSQHEGWAGRSQLSAADTGLLDADEEELQLFGDIFTDDGAAHIFGNSGSAIAFYAAAPTFNVVSTLRVGIKQASKIDAANGPATRATIGAAAFDVYKDLVAGVDTIATGAQSVNMATLAAGAITLTPGDQCAICFHLAKPSGTSTLIIRQTTPTTQLGYGGSATLVTSGPTYTALTVINSVMLKCNDGHYAWITPTVPASIISDVNSGTIGNTNIKANIIRAPFPFKVQGIAAVLTAAATANFSFDFYTTPLVTPGQAATVAHDANEQSAASAARLVTKILPTPITCAANTDYAVGVRQTTANAVTVVQRDVLETGHWYAAGGGPNCYGADSTAGATFAQALSGRRRYQVWALISHLDDGVSSDRRSPMTGGMSV